MAKQSVSFVERHMEKIVVGVAGLVTLSLAALFVVQDPNSVESNGTSVGPGEIGARLKQETKSVYESIKAAKAQKVAVPDYVAEVERSRPSQIDRGLALRLPVAPTPLNPQPPAVARLDIMGKNRLAKILAPGKPVTFQGRNRATLAAPTALAGMADAAGARDAAAAAQSDATTAQDITWVTVAAPVFRAKQLDEFSAAGYVPSRSAIVLSSVRLERQRLLADGTWSEPPEAVKTYTKYLPFTAPQVKLTEDDSGWNVDADSAKRFETLNAELKKPDTRAPMWRPPLAPYLDLTEWPPSGAPQIEDVAWEDWPNQAAPRSGFKGQGTTGGADASGRTTRKEVAKPRRTTRPPSAEPKDTSATRTPSPAKKATDDERAKAITTAQKNIREAKKAYKENDLQTANKLLDDVLREDGKAALPSNITSEAETLKTKIEEELKVAMEKAEKMKEDREARLSGKIEADVEPVWAHDLTAQPGRTYRYRIQIELLNEYAGLPRDLAEPRDAEKVLLASDWSDWSDPVTVRPDTYFFVQSINKEGTDGQAIVDLYKWSDGEWKSVSRRKFDIGQQIACEDRKAGHIDTQMTVVDIDMAAKRAIRTKPRRDGSFDIETKDGLPVLLIADSDGQIWERNTLDDRNAADLAKKEMQKENQPR